MASSGLKKMLFFIISNTEGVRVLVCPAIVLDIGWASVVDGLPPGRCYACILADVGQCCFAYADVIVILFVADIIATIMYFIGRCCCHSLYVVGLVADVVATVAVVLPLVGMLYHLWQMLLPSLLADVIAILVCCCVLWQMLLPLWLMVLPFVRMM